MTVLLKDAIQPNLLQTLENNPAFVHGGPFANIAHGCNCDCHKNSVKACGLCCDRGRFWSGFRSGKIPKHQMPKGGLSPSAVVLVATVRAMKMNGGVAKNDLNNENVAAVKAGCPNLGRHRKLEIIWRACTGCN